MWIWIHVWVLRLHFFFFFCACVSKGQNSLFTYCLTLFTHCLCTVYETHSHFIQKKNLKMGLTVLFTHLKIILLQCFQFSIFNFSKNKLYPNGPKCCLLVYNTIFFEKKNLYIFNGCVWILLLFTICYYHNLSLVEEKLVYDSYA